MQGFSGKMEITNKRLIITIDKENKCVQFGHNKMIEELQRPPQDFVILLENIKQIYPRRHHLVRSAFEIYTTYQKSIFFNFNFNDYSKVYKKILSLKPINLEFNETEFEKTELTKLWVTRQISNFDYIMKLNMYAGMKLIKYRENV
jgi:hypothetical protein